MGRDIAVSGGPLFSWVVQRRLALGLGARLESVFLARPPVGPCDDAHGCNGVFYPDERSRGMISFIPFEVTVTYDLL